LVSSNYIRCDYNFFSPRVAFVDETKNRYDNNQEFSIDFHYVDDIYNISENNWTDNYIGSTDIKNTTFLELLKMVKEDCSQFQKNKEEGEITWGYRKAEPQKERTPKEQKRYDEIIKNIKVRSVTPEEEKENNKELDEIFGGI
jgi:hypothetical protein